MNKFNSNLWTNLFIAKDHNDEVIEYILVDYCADYDDVLAHIENAGYEEEYSEENSYFADVGAHIK